MTSLQLTWFLILVGMFTMYAILDGFDLGAGFWHVFLKKGRERNANINAIAPYWDGNEVWLISGGGALFAAFPAVYATFTAGFYLAILLLLLGLILRAVSIEFREKVDSPRWQAFWDVGLTIGSAIPALLFGVALANILRGLPLDAQGNYTGTFLQLLNPFSLLLGVVGLAALAMHGALYLGMKTRDEVRQRSARRALVMWTLYTVGAVAFLAWAWIACPWLRTNFKAHPWTIAAPATFLIALATLPELIRRRSMLPAFLASSLSLAAFLATAAAALFPTLIPASNAPEFSLTIANASSSPKTLSVMFTIACIGLPPVLLYSIFVYWLIEKKINLEERTY